MLQRALVAFLLLVLLALPGALAGIYGVAEEQVVVGTTTGPAALAAADGTVETLQEAVVTVDLPFHPASEALGPGSTAGGTFPAALAASDDISMHYRETPTGLPDLALRNPGTAGSCTFTSGDSGRLSDDIFALSPAATDYCTYGNFALAIPAGSIVTKVELGYEAFTTGDDAWTLYLSFDGGINWCPGRTTPSLPTADPNAYSFEDFTACRSWTAAEVNALASLFVHAAVGATDANSLDANAARITYIPPGAYALAVEYNWTGVASGGPWTLIVEGHVSDEAISVEVLTPPASWTARLTLNALGDAVLAYNLTPAEVGNGSVAVRFVDAGPDPSSSDLWVDEVKVVAHRPAYRLDVRQNITGVTGIAPLLRLRGNVSPDGENFDLWVWNFSGGRWDQRLAAPFTAARADHNVSLGAAEVGGGIVRLRYTDADPGDASPSNLTLDLVAVATGPAPPPGPMGGGWPLLLAALGFVPLVLLFLLLPRGRIEEVFLVNGSGLLMAHLSSSLTPDRDRDLVTGMLTVVQDFIRDSFGPGGGELRRMEFDRREIAIRRGALAYLAVVCKGRTPLGLGARMGRTLARIEEAFAAVLPAWDGRAASLAGVKDCLAEGLLEGWWARRARR